MEMLKGVGVQVGAGELTALIHKQASPTLLVWFLLSWNPWFLSPLCLQHRYSRKKVHLLRRVGPAPPRSPVQCSSRAPPVPARGQKCDGCWETSSLETVLLCRATVQAKLVQSEGKLKERKGGQRETYFCQSTSGGVGTESTPDPTGRNAPTLEPLFQLPS